MVPYAHAAVLGVPDDVGISAGAALQVRPGICPASDDACASTCIMLRVRVAAHGVPADACASAGTANYARAVIDGMTAGGCAAEPRAVCKVSDDACASVSVVASVRLCARDGRAVVSLTLKWQ